MKGMWEAVEVGVDEWFLGIREGEGPGDGYSPFVDLGDCDRELAERIALCLNVCRRLSDAQLRLIADYSPQESIRRAK